MTDAILTLNAGSSSLKVGLYDAAAGGQQIADGQVESLGGDAKMEMTFTTGAETERALDPGASDHAGALDAILSQIEAQAPGTTIRAVSHRFVHGGTEMTDSRVIDADLERDLRDLAPFAPLHQPHHLSCLDAAREAFPEAVQVACADTAFHRGQPFIHDAFALPRRLYDEGIRRYGFHGLSYDYIAGHLKEVHPGLHAGRVVVAHLGNGASICALHEGRGVASTMGFTPLDGLPMGTRTGHLDPGVILYLLTEAGMDIAEVSDMLWKRSGLLGLSGISNDMRALEASDAPEAEQAIAYFVARIREQIAGLAAALGGIDALVFTAGIGENSDTVRARVTEGLGWMGIAIDPALNAEGAGEITADGARVRTLVIPTDEEAVLAREARRHLA